ncbi:MAG: uracil-xanthine permease family protein [Eubacteriales bacterium]|nr:uracil-xanthine permease family protein [Eubacteriales bacterium]
MSEISTHKKLLLGIQHVLAMFGATVLVPFLTGLNPAIAIFSAGVGTLLFHFVTKKIVPVFLGSSFAFIGAIALTLNPNGFSPAELISNENWGTYLQNLSNVKGGIIAAGVVYMLLSVVIYYAGVDAVKKFFPPIITGPIIIVIGLRLSPVAINNSFYLNGQFDLKSALVACIVVITMIVISIFTKGFFQLVPILISVIVGYIISIPLNLVDLSGFKDASVFTFSSSAILDQALTVPNFSWSNIIAIAPIALVVFIEHIGDITTNGAVVGKNFFENPGIHRTLFGDGIATVFAGLVGGPANTTYSENTGVLAVTKVYDPAILRIAAVFAIIFSMSGHLAYLVQSIPVPVMGGVSIILFGMIASVGVRILITSNLDFAYSRNLLISAVILVLGIGISELPLAANLSISGLAVAALVGIVLNQILPEEI